jgi:hypothetical protein
MTLINFGKSPGAPRGAGGRAVASARASRPDHRRGVPEDPIARLTSIRSANCLFLKRDIHTRGAIEFALYGNAECHEGTVKNYVARLRARLEPHGIQIDTVHGKGWQMGGEAKERFWAEFVPVRA